MFPALWAAAAEAGPIILLPVSITIGFIGYKIESYITRNKEDNQRASIIVSAHNCLTLKLSLLEQSNSLSQHVAHYGSVEISSAVCTDSHAAGFHGCRVHRI